MDVLPGNLVASISFCRRGFLRERTVYKRKRGCSQDMFVKEVAMERHAQSRSHEIIHTTIGELVEAITQIALEAGKTKAEGYRLASLAIEDLLRRNRKKQVMIH